MTHSMYNLPLTLQRLLCTIKLLYMSTLVALYLLDLYIADPVVRSSYI